MSDWISLHDLFRQALDDEIWDERGLPRGKWTEAEREMAREWS